MCSSCDQFDTEIIIHSPGQLKSLVEKIRFAIKQHEILYSAYESDRARKDQTPFDQLDLDSSIPDVMRYYFNCPQCGATFKLECESYHGAGGKWAKVTT